VEKEEAVVEEAMDEDTIEKDAIAVVEDAILSNQPLSGFFPSSSTPSTLMRLPNTNSTPPSSI